jgi:protein required for attachment to host cells
MPSTGIIVADGARARFITFHPPDELTPERGTDLIEHSDLINPEGELPARELFSDRQGRTHGSPNGSAHGPDDHREEHQLELTRRFVRRILEEASRFITEHSPGRVVLAAEPRLLGIVRSELEHHALHRAQITTLAEDLSRRSLGDIAGILAQHGLLPPVRPPRAGVYRPRGQPPSRPR